MMHSQNRKKIRLQIGEFLLVIPLPSLTEQQKKTLLAAGLSVIFNLAVIAFLRWAGAVHPEYVMAIDPQKMVIMKLQEEEEIKKARELFENPLANRRRPEHATILSDRDSRSDITTLPKDITIVPGSAGVSGGAEIAGKTAEEAREEESFSNLAPVVPFMERQKKSVLESITGKSEVPRGWGGQVYELNTYQWDFAPYMLKWKNKMTEHWYKITSRINFNPFAPLGSMRIYVKVDRSGRLLDSRILDYNCDRSFVAPAYASVLNSFPLDPLPSSFPDDFLETTWTITIVNQ